MKPDGFERMLHYLPEKFERARTRCHVFVTDCDENAVSLLRQSHQSADDNNISIHSAVLDISKCKISSEDVKHTLIRVDISDCI